MMCAMSFCDRQKGDKETRQRKSSRKERVEGCAGREKRGERRGGRWRKIQRGLRMGMGVSRH